VPAVAPELRSSTRTADRYPFGMTLTVTGTWLVPRLTVEVLNFST
jgi:hypothetical protein